MNFSCVERYASEITVYSSKSPLGRKERGFVQPLELWSSQGENTPPGRGSGTYLLIAGPEVIDTEERNVRIGARGLLFRLLIREEYGLAELAHIECRLRYLGRDEHA